MLTRRVPLYWVVLAAAAVGLAGWLARPSAGQAPAAAPPRPGAATSATSATSASSAAAAATGPAARPPPWRARQLPDLEFHGVPLAAVADVLRAVSYHPAVAVDWRALGGAG